MTIQRGFDTALIPIWDMVNHDNGKLNTDSNSQLAEEGIKVWANRTIAAGEEIYATYDYCQDCSDFGDWMGTPGIFRDFGFVESYPQYWPFVGQSIYFSVQAAESVKSLDFLKSRLSRLESMEATHLTSRGSIPQYQWDGIVQFHNAFMNALECGIEAMLGLWSNRAYLEHGGADGGYEIIDEL
eukprot:CAMPEP_0117068972 /NCGR_PEP_ID=MMETSP0472-20121206/48344_1 /TAXON_ID=693140 ORGANISM="Tiarina fusus, Strain LIS" /NCGR_SAMPLE_ID=MMETSP0472 /ASSEMBLY_ACC=CAM_ASM_000603 /LENGTH=183 /DNA_ID=CAMNT_0004791259 /DNA_START=1 /DNA_END=552 /DNA_ORIENTATION=+